MFLERLLNKSQIIEVEDSNDPDFKNWKNLVERTVIKVFGKTSIEYEHFSKLRFHHNAIAYTLNNDFTADHLRSFRHDLKILLDSISEYIEEFKAELYITPEVPKSIKYKPKVSKVFISHASNDSKIVEEIIELLETIGIESNQIFCTSFEGYGIELGEDFLDVIKEELSLDSLVLFVLSEEFYKSPVCMCEMGAAWVLSKAHIPIIIPPLSYEDIEGVIPLTQGFKLSEPLKLNLFKEKIEDLFTIANKLSFSTWERKRDRVCSRIDRLIN